VHPLGLLRGEGGQQRCDDLDSVPESLEGQARGVDTRGPPRIDLSGTRRRLLVQAVHRGQERRRETLPRFCFPQRKMRLVDTLSHLGGSGIPDLSFRPAQQAFLSSLELSSERAEYRQVFGHLCHLQQHDLHITHLVQVRKESFQQAAGLLGARVRIQAPDNVEHSQHATRAHTQVMDICLGPLAPAGPESATVLLPEALEGCNGGKLSSDGHESVFAILDSAPKLSLKGPSCRPLCAGPSNPPRSALLHSVHFTPQRQMPDIQARLLLRIFSDNVCLPSS
jgi:hypothetical protein